MSAPDSGYAPTSVVLTVQSTDDQDTDGEIVHLTIPYGGRVFTDQFVSDVVTALTAAALLPFPGGRIMQAQCAYTGQATVTVRADPDPDA